MGRSVNKLLDKPLKAFTIYAFVVLLCSIPVYFLMIDWIWINEVNEHNLIVAESTKRNLASLNLNDKQLEESARLWTKLQPDAELKQVSAWKPDSTYNIYRKNVYIPKKGYDRFHGLVTCFTMNGKIYSLTVETNIEESYETIAAITAITVLFFVILLIGFIKLNKRISAKLWLPFYLTLEKIKVFDLNNQQNISFEASGIVEFDEMNTSINKLIESNVTAYRHQKEFIENASHELQTPLAVIQSKLDMLFQSSEITGEQSTIIEKAQNALSRASRINKNLLLLAKIENQQFLDIELIDMRLLLQEMLSLLADFKEDQPIQVDIKSELKLSGNKMLVEIMLTNLLMNAIRHAEPEGEIGISLDHSQLTISNTGSVALQEEKLFKRFSAAAKQTPGSGLGLSIVKEICARYHWTVRYQHIDAKHVFIIYFGHS